MNVLLVGVLGYKYLFGIGIHPVGTTSRVGIAVQSAIVTVYCDLNLLSLVTVHTVQNQQTPITDSVRFQQLLNPV